MGLFDAIPGLSVYGPVESPLVDVVAFDHAAASALVSTTYEAVAAAYPGNDVMDWLVANRPDVVAEIRKGRVSIREADQALDMVLLQRACARFIRLHDRAWAVYAERPPIVETQSVLFGAGE